MPIDLFSTRTMLRALDQMLPPKTFLTDLFFSETDTSDTEYVDIDVRKGKRRLAPYVRPTAAAKLMEAIGYLTRSYKPPYVKAMTTTEAGKFLKRNFGTNPYASSPSPQQRAAQRLNQDINEMWETVVRRFEQMVAEILRTGKLRVVGDGIDVTIDFLMNPAHTITLTGTDLWSDPGSDPLKDIRDWKRMIAQAVGLNLSVMILGSDVTNAFLKHSEIRSLLDNRNFNVGQIDISNVNLANATGATPIGRIEGIDFFEYNEWYIDPATGLEQPMVPADRIIAGATDARLSKLYGAIEDDESLVPVPFFPTSWKEKNPPRRMVMIQSAPLPGFHQPDAFLSIKAV